MFLCGSNFLGGAMSYALTPTDMGSVTHIEIQNGMYDDLYGTNNADYELTDKTQEEWDYDTQFHMPFQSNTNGGNIDWTIGTITNIIVKARPKGSFNWHTIYEKEIPENPTIDDFNLDFTDYLQRSGVDLEYAIVPVLQGVEGTYALSEIKSEFEKLIIIDQGKSYGTFITDGFVDTDRNFTSSNVELLHNKYPVFVRNGEANYDTGSITASFAPTEDGECALMEFNGETDYRRVMFQKDVIDMLANGKPKLIKNSDGRCWIAQIVSAIGDHANDHFRNRELSINFVEIGSCESPEDLYFAGLSDIPEEWW